jgi:hypothetical protein
MKSQLHQVYLKAKNQFIKFEGVVGVGFGPKLRDNKEVVPEAIIIFVQKKLPKKEIPKGQLIPSVYQGFPTDVREPKLNIKRGKNFNPNAPPDPEDECLTDYFWIDWQKIHELNKKQKRQSSRGRQSDEPADAPTVEVFGDLFIIKDPDQTLITMVGGSSTIDYVSAYNLFRGTFGDHYDFVTFFIDVGSGLPDVGNASNYIFNNVNGIGWPSVNSRSTWMGSTKLLRHIHHTWFSLRTLLHELSHQWSFFVDYRDTMAGPTQDLLHQDWIYGASQRIYHWGRWPDNDITCMDYDRADWIDNGDGTFNRVRHYENSVGDEEWFGFSHLDQYLMGLIPASDVPGIKIVQSPSPTISDATTGPYTPSPSALNIGISNVQYEEGARSPDFLNSQRVFHQAFIVITKNTTVPTTFITDSQTWRTRHTSNLRRAAAGRAMVDTSLLRSNYSDLYIKDNDADTGLGTSTGAFWASPDLWVRNMDDNMPGMQNTIRNQSNWIYARIRNKSLQPYENVKVNFYLANFLSLVPGTEFLYPVDWNPMGLLGSATISVPAASGGMEGTAIAKIEWTADKIPPALGWHPCLLCEIIPMEIAPTGLHHVFANKKLAQVNITIIDPPMDLPANSWYIFNYKFAIGHQLDTYEQIDLRIVTPQQDKNLYLFLDTGGLVENISEEGEIVEGDVDIPLAQLMSDKIGVLPTLPVHFKPNIRYVQKPISLNGGIYFIPSGTQIGIAPPGKSSELNIPWLKFVDSTRIQFGYGKEDSLSSKYRLKGLKPVLLQGIPLLEVSDPTDARITFRMNPQQKTLFSLIGIVPTTGNKGKIVYDITQSVGHQIVGGLRLIVNT